MRYYKYPKWPRKLYPGAVWDFFYHEEKIIYLTFDDGPNPETTPWLLQLLDKFNAKATFFCLGENVKEYPELYAQILEKGHRTGNHSMTHPKGWKISTSEYLIDVENASKYIDSKLFRPPYGKFKPSQFKALKKEGYQMIFWSVMAYDFDDQLASEHRMNMLRKYVTAGSIVVFHDSQKVIENLKKELPVLLQEWQDQGFQFKSIM